MATASEQATRSLNGYRAMPQPLTIAETGIDFALLVDLLLKTLHFAGRPSARQLSDQLALSHPVIDSLLAFLRQEQAAEIMGSSGVGEQSYQYSLTDRGRHKAAEALERNQYVGPTPVPFDQYVEVVDHQSVRNITISPETFLRELSHMVLGKKLLATLGPAIASGRSMLIYGASGNGKSTITMAVGRMLPGAVLVPYAVEVHGQIIRVFDPRLHQRVAEEVDPDRRHENGQQPVGVERRLDRRWEACKRPIVSAGGELTLEDLELRFSPVSRFYVAPLQWKANGGILIIDDFGRQLVQPQELLNRWIVPMEQSVDHVSLQSGETLEIPFDTVLIFSSNIQPGRLGDEAFFRRIRHKVEIPNPTAEEFHEILLRACTNYKVAYTEEGAQHMMNAHYRNANRDLKSCHPRDLVELVLDICTFYGEEPVLSPDRLDLAAANYFVENVV